MLTGLSTARLNGRPRPKRRILQFGGGNFLRAFIDWKIDRMNEAGGLDWGIVILRSVGTSADSNLNAQDGLYTVLTRGIGPGGDAIDHARIVASVLGEIDCRTEWQRVLDLAADPDISTIVSNTTEAGIVHDPSARLHDAPPASFPAKVALLLAHRWRLLSGRPGTGWEFIPCELNDRNGDALRAVVLRHATDWALPQAFVRWVMSECTFYNTLVDRIVSGFPSGEIAGIEDRLGYRDPCLVTAEHHHFLALERRDGQPLPQLPLADWDDGTQVVGDIAPYRLRKVAILNGGHTALCPLALISRTETVAEAMEEGWASAFLRAFWDREVKPFLPFPQTELDAYADEVLLRFSNPFIRHRWTDISLNGLAKVRVRNLDRLRQHLSRFGEPPAMQALSLAAWIAIYSGKGPAPPRDADGVEQLTTAIAEADDGTGGGRLNCVRAFLENESLWGAPIADPALTKAVASAYGSILEGADIPTLVLSTLRDRPG